MTTLQTEFGEILIKRTARARHLTLKPNALGQLQITAPRYASNSVLAEFIKQASPKISQLLETRPAKIYQAGQIIGKTDMLKLEYLARLTAPRIVNRPNFIVVQLPFDWRIEQPEVQQLLKQAIQKSLRRQAKVYLLPRAQFLARQLGFTVRKWRLSHATTRWGSCTTQGVISLNIALLNLEQPLIDYVIIHELCHLRHMNHSPAFWQLVEQFLPNYRQLRRQCQQFSPNL